MNEFKYCPNCAEPIKEDNDHWKCSTCGSEYWRNSKPCAGVLPIKNGKVLITKRAIEPYKGSYDIIGGFLKNGEMPLDGALREAREETGLDVKILDFLGVYVDIYTNEKDFNLIFYYVCEIPDVDIKPQDDVASLHWIDLNDIPSDIAVKHVPKVLEDLRNWYQKRK
jgi:NAD+ diphosphatase